MEQIKRRNLYYYTLFLKPQVPKEDQSELQILFLEFESGLSHPKLTLAMAFNCIFISIYLRETKNYLTDLTNGGWLT